MKAAGEGAPKLKTKRSVPKAARTTDSDALSNVIARYGGGPVQLTGSESALYERQLTFDNVLAAPGAFGEPIAIEGCVYDGLGAPIGDALLEVWQADGRGRYQHALDPSAEPRDPRFRGFGRAATDVRGGYTFASVKPGAVQGPNGGLQAPHVNLVLGARGMTRHAFTRIYFDGDAALAADAVLALVPAQRRQTLIARRSGLRDGVSVYRFDVRLQGEHETVFFEL